MGCIVSDLGTQRGALFLNVLYSCVVFKCFIMHVLQDKEHEQTRDELKQRGILLCEVGIVVSVVLCR